MGERIKNKFNSIRDAQFVIDMQQGFLHGIFGNAESKRDFAISGTFGNQVYDLVLARRKNVPSFGIDHARRGRRCKGFDQVSRLLGVRPELSAVNDGDAAAEGLK